jgi:hypothetical protein
VTPPSQCHAPGTYQIRVAGHLDDHWATWFGGMTLQRDSDGTTTLTGPVADQAQLHGLLARIRDLGVTLISLQAQAAQALSHDSPAPHRRQDDDGSSR